MEQNKIIVTGGSGMVGKSLKKYFPNAVYLSSSDYDLTLESGVSKMFEDLKPKCIIHLAAKVGGIFDNMNKPGEYFTDNVLMNTLMVDYAKKNDVERFIAISSTCIYPDKLDVYPMKEADLHLGPPTATNFAYGYAKRAMTVQIDAYNKQYGTKYQYLTACNMYGEFDKYGESSHFVAALIKKIHNAKVAGSNTLDLFGTGKPLRQFMHSDDLAKVIATCINQNIFDSFNVATTENISIEDIAKIALKACDASDIKLSFDTTKPDGQFRKDVSNLKIKSIIPEFNPMSLEEGIKKTYSVLKTEWIA